jgi:hypothetical protein
LLVSRWLAGAAAEVHLALLSSWVAVVLAGETSGFADAAGIVFVAYVNALWRLTDPGRSEWIQEFGAKVDKLVDPVLTRYGREGASRIAELRGNAR